jgi:hypothetical protein
MVNSKKNVKKKKKKQVQILQGNRTNGNSFDKYKFTFVVFNLSSNHDLTSSTCKYQEKE